MAKKMCVRCGKNPATVPDRTRPGRLINRVCGDCHAARLRGDIQRIIDFAAKLERERNGDR